MLAVPTEPGEPGHDAGGRSLRVDTWLMSCRVIARTVEQAFFSELVRRARDMGVTRLVGEYIPTKKNGQVADLWTRVGATPLPPGDGELRQWVLDLDGFEPPAHFVDLG
jgi:predicted enzyme involved in methoxymalonyl-ACP biosynthesis